MFNVTKFPTKAKVIDCGLGESNLLNVASGIASQGNSVYVYGVAGFIIHRLQQLKLTVKHFACDKGKVVICNAGKYGYSDLGIGHDISDDVGIMKLLDIPFYAPDTLEEFVGLIDMLDSKSTGVYYIQLGRDYER